MGLFNYSKPGPGVSKDAPKKKGIFLYFDIFARKFSKLFLLNLLYFLCSLPVIILYFLIFLLMIPDFVICLFLSLAFTIVLGSGPASAAMAYVMRQFSREEHVWLTSSFFGKMKENFKQELVVVIADLAFAFVCPFAVIYYLKQYWASGSVLWIAMLVIFAVFSFLFASAHYYIHQLIVTFENNLKNTYKNAMFFALSTVFQNIILTVFSLGILYLLVDFLDPLILLILSLFILIAFLRFPVEFFSHSSIKKTIKYEIKETTIEEEVVFSDSHGSDK